MPMSMYEYDELQPFVYERSAPDPIDLDPVPVSREVIKHVVRLHEEQCGAAFVGVHCDCTTAIVLVCTRCSRPVYVCTSLHSTCTVAARLSSHGVPLQRWSS